MNGNGDPAKDTFALLKILDLGEKQIRHGKVRTAADVLKHLRSQRGAT